MVDTLPTTLDVSVEIIVEQPDMAQLIAASEARSTVIIGVALFEIDGGETRTSYSHKELEVIRDILYDGERHKVEFTARTSHSYQHSSYGQTSTRTTYRYYLVTLFTDGTGSYLREIDENPRPRRY